MTDITAKARRAAEWWNAKRPGKVNPIKCYCKPWIVVTETGDEAGEWECSDAQLIKDAEDRGWQDQDHEADGVEWRVLMEVAYLENCYLLIEWDPAVLEYLWLLREGDEIERARGTAPTRAEARAAAAKAARGMG